MMEKTESPLVKTSTVGSESDGQQKRRRVGVNAASVSVSDAEVEEFYAILRRVRAGRAASRTCRKAQSEVPAWSPSFAPEDFAVGIDGTKERGGGETPAVRRPLDLNVIPEPEL